MKKIIKFFAQKMADGIVHKLENAKSKEEAEKAFNSGMALNNYCINMWNLYLD